MNKKIIILLALIILLSFGMGAILLLNKKQDQPSSAEPAETSIKKLVDEVVVSPIKSFDGSAIWYFNASGRLFRISVDGSGLTEYPLPPLPKGSLLQALWPEKGGNFIVTTSASSGGTKYFYDDQEKKYVELPGNIQSLDWMPDGERIAYVWKAGDNSQQLKMASADSSGFKTLADLFWPDYVVKVSPKGDEALLYRSEASETNRIYRVDFRRGSFEPVIESGRNSGMLWLPGGEKFIFAQAFGSGQRLLMYNFSNRQITDLNLAASIDKIGLGDGGKTLYAAVAKKGSNGDEFVKLELTSLKQETHYLPAEDIKAKNLLEANGKLYFVNLIDSKFYYIAK
ncbi:MAG: hypothetical protein HYV13_03415 [Candidatus Doudnabacteria bacterium]|nr:hypothetical protein [Candidatus Doudnabacteria bacterium]